MSYILDAIKKAEKQRQIEQIHTLESSVAFQPDPRRRFPWKKGALISILIFSILLGWFYRQPVVGHLKQIKASLLINLFEEKDRQATETVSIGSEQDTQSQQQPVVEPDLTSTSAGQAESAEKVTKDPTQPSEADLEILGKIRFSVISYSQDDEKRFVMDGVNIFREGDKVMGFSIVSIKKSSVIVDVKGSPYEINL